MRAFPLEHTKLSSWRSSKFKRRLDKTLRDFCVLDVLFLTARHIFINRLQGDISSV